MHSRIDLLNNLYHINARQIDQLVRANAEISRASVNIINREQHVSRDQPSQYTATRVAMYGDITRPQNTTCPISLDSFEDSQLVTVIRHCGHIFNTEQIGAWFRANCRCPVCRYDIRNYRASQHILDVSANTPVNNTDDISMDDDEQ